MLLYLDDVDINSIDIKYSRELIRLQQFTNHLIDSFFFAVFVTVPMSVPLVQWKSRGFNTYVIAF